MAMRAVSCGLDQSVKAGGCDRLGSLAAVRAAVARRGVLVVDDVADPVLGPGDALVAVKACGICGSDLHALHYADELVAIAREMGAPITFDPARDFIMGHEFTGEVLELGPHDRRCAGAGRAISSRRCRSRSRRPGWSRSARTRTSTTARTPTACA